MTALALRRRPALRVGVDASLTGAPRGTGAGNAFHQCLERLADRVRLVELDHRCRRGLLSRAPRVDVVLASGHAHPPEVGAAPLVVFVHEVGWADPGLRSFLAPRFAATMAEATEHAVAAAARVLVPSHASAEQVVATYGIERHRVVTAHHGVDCDLFRPDRRRAAATPYVLYVGTVHPRKNLPALRDAMATLARRGLPHELVLVVSPAPDRPGSDDLMAAALADLDGAPGRVRRVVAPDDCTLAGLYAGADAFCLPSHWEGFGLPALEAMAAGCAVVVSDRGALPEVVGEAGLVVPPEPDAVAGALARVLEDRCLREHLGRAARRRAEGFTWDRTAALWARALTEAAEAGGDR